MQAIMKKELDTFFAALMYYSRIPVPSSHVFSESTLVNAFRYFPLVGILVGIIGGGVFWIGSGILPNSIAVLMALAVIMLLTGAIHEDGFADAFDGFGGGSSADSILNIMKDSHIGTYGVLALIMLLGFKVAALLAIPAEQIPFVFIAAHGVSRVPAIFLIKTSTYARQGQSKAKHVRLGVSTTSLLIGSFIGLLALTVCPGKVAWTYLTLAVLAVIPYRSFLHRKIGGFTGDTLGALQQGMEVLFYITYLALAVS